MNKKESLSRYGILIVDDVPLNQFLVKKMLESFNFGDILHVLLLTIINTAITYVLILILQVLFVRKRDN